MPAGMRRILPLIPGESYGRTVMHEYHSDAAQGEATALRQALEDEKQRHLRTLADFDNYRKRVERDSLSASDSGKKELAGNLLEVLDNLDRALARVVDPEARRGLELIGRQLLDILARHGLEAVECLGRPFNPEEHEGAGYIEDHRYPPGYVADEVRRGYRFAGGLLRPAIVMVAKGR